MYYHYTNHRGATAIRSSGYLQPSEESGAFGPGVYLTDLDPSEFFRDEILVNNYGGIRSEFHNRADWVVEILEENINMHLLRQVHVPGENDRRIFLYPYFILVQPNQIIDKPRCLKSYVVDDYDTSTDDTDDTEDIYFESESEGNFSDEHGTDANDNTNSESLSDECEIEEHEDLSIVSEGEECVCCEYETDGNDGDVSYVNGGAESGNDEFEYETNGNDGAAFYVSGSEESGSDEGETDESSDGSMASFGDYEDLDYGSEEDYYED